MARVRSLFASRLQGIHRPHPAIALMEHRIALPVLARHVTTRNTRRTSPSDQLPRSQTSSSSAPSSVPPSSHSSLIQRYAPRLHALSTRTGVPLPSLIISFLILHEFTAIIPLLFLFFLFQSLGAGAAFVGYLDDLTDGTSATEEEGGRWDWRKVVGGWVEEGQKRVERVGRRYGILGYEKGEKGDAGGGEADVAEVGSSWTLAKAGRSGGDVGGGVANAIAAYVVVKALLPVRIGVSIGAAPTFARFALEPLRRLGLHITRRSTRV